MATLRDYRTAIDDLTAHFNEGRLSKATYLITKRAIHNQVFKVLRDVYRTWDSEHYYREVKEADFLAIASKVDVFYGTAGRTAQVHAEETRKAKEARFAWRCGDPV